MARIKTYYFSPTGGTLHVARHLAETLGWLLHATVEYHSYTVPREREEQPQFNADDIILWATPVYAGRIPNKTLDYVRNAIHANGNPSVALVTFGNRAYDNALAELVGLMEDGGMKPMGAAAMVTRHAFSDTLGAGRPNEEDLAALADVKDARVSKRTGVSEVVFVGLKEGIVCDNESAVKVMAYLLEVIKTSGRL